MANPKVEPMYTFVLSQNKVTGRQGQHTDTITVNPHAHIVSGRLYVHPFCNME